MKKALLIVDVQNDFLKNGSLEVKDSNSIIPIINKLIEKFSYDSDEVIATQDYHPKDHKSFASVSKQTIGTVGILNGISQIWWPDHCIEGTFGAELSSSLLKINTIVQKGKNKEFDSYSGFFDNNKKFSTELHSILQKKNISELYIVGIATDYCVKYTVLDAISLGYKVNLIKDACAGINKETVDSALKEMKESGAKIIFSKILFSI